MNRLFVFLSILMTTFIISCRNISEFNNEDAERNKWLASFLQNKKIIEGKYNHTEDIIEFSIEVNSIESFFSKTDSIALTESWQMNSVDLSYRVYTKEMKTEGGYIEVIILKMEFRPPNFLKVTAY